MGGLIQMRHTIIQTIDRHQILNQVIRPNTEKISFLRQQIDNRRRAGNLDHRTHLNRLVKRLIFTPEFSLDRL